MRILLHCAIVALGAARLAAAQTAQPDMVSRKLVEEIAGGDTLLVGQLPAKLQGKLYLPATSRVVGSLGQAALIASSLSTEQTLKDLEREMPKLGWKLLLHSRPDWGFVFAKEDQRDYGLVFCGNDTWLTISSVPSTAPGSRFRVAADRVFSSCEGVSFIQGGRWRPPPTYDGAPVRLLNPTAARAAAYDVCMPATMAWDNASQVMLETSLGIDSLLAWYGKQLDDAGWVAAKPGSASKSWTRVDSTGKTAQLDLRVETKPDMPRCKDASYRIRLVKPPL
jgi:hypothetical protein